MSVNIPKTASGQRRGRKARLPLAIEDKGGNGVGSKVSIPVRHGSTGPFDAETGFGPNSEERAALWEGEPPPIDEAHVRRVHDMNKELADDLRRNMTIKVGRLKAGPPLNHLVRKE